MTAKIGMRFIIEEPIYSYNYARQTPQEETKKEAYQEYKKRIRQLATKAGIPLRILPTKYADIKVTFYWKSNARLDLSNTWKAIEDGIFSQDRNVHKIRLTTFEHTTHEQAIVRVRIRNRSKRDFPSRIFTLLEQWNRKKPSQPMPHRLLLQTSRMTAHQVKIAITSLNQQDLISIKRIYNGRGTVYLLKEPKEDKIHPPCSGNGTPSKVNP